ncbi:MAG: ABC transporter substrate-binding protein [Deltaproteobacteria bacterium]|jgi:iron complex transport system substrate-binding protein|nr:ABC transporter substrate-binding protein [Deltaproteobacteria bacterium]
MNSTRRQAVAVKRAAWAVFFWASLLVAAPAAAEDRGDLRTVYGATHPSTFALYALDPDLLGGWNTLLRGYEKKFIPEKYQSLPVLGGWYGAGYTPDREVLISSGLRKAFYLGGQYHDRLGIAAVLEELGMEVVMIPAEFSKTPETFRAMGQAFNRPERGEALAGYAQAVIERLRSSVGGLAADQRPRVFLALGVDGLTSICRRSDRSEAIYLAGGENVYECPDEMAEANLQLGLEEIMRLDPDVVLVYSPELAAVIEDEPGWGQLRAVKAGRWRLVPRGPFSWLERPATYMRLIGAQWLANWLHPDLYPLDVKAELRVFLKLFFGLEADDQQIDELLTQ